MRTHVLLKDREILGRVSYPDDYPLMNGWVYMEVPEDYTNYYVINSRVVRKPRQPTEWHDFDYTNLTWSLNLDYFWGTVRRKRNQLILDCDWTQLPDVKDSMLPAEQEAWTTYRQALRDITEQTPPNIIWPIAPS